MEASTSARVEWPKGIEQRLVSRLAHFVVVVGLALLAAGGVLIFMRRASGALVEPAPLLVLLAWAVFLAVAAVAARIIWPSPIAVSRRAAYVCSGVISFVVLLWAIGLSAGTVGSDLICIWSVLVLEEGWSWLRLVRNPPAVRAAFTAPPVSHHLSTGGTSTLLNDALDEERVDEVDEAISQQIERRVQDDGLEIMTGWVAADVPAQARHATAHIAICPPFERVPECFAEQMDGPAATIKVAQVLHHGVRFEIKLDEPAVEAARVLVEFSIQERGEA